MLDLTGDESIARIDLYLDDAKEPFSTIVPPAPIEIDTTTLEDGPHTLRLVAYDTMGKVGRRTIPFTVQNGPGITVTGLRAQERVHGRLSLQVNAFGGDEPFDPVRAESSGPIPVWTWVMSVIVVGWAMWYGLALFKTPPTYAATPTYEAHPVAMAQAASTASTPAPASPRASSAGGFNYTATGANLYAQNCAACHGASGSGVPGAFPPLPHDPVVTAANPAQHIAVVLHGLHGKAINGTSYSSQMPSFSQLSNDDIAAIIDHERTSWGNNAPTVTPQQVQRAR
jgi:mono/diheme cytochrome c family protein